MELTCSPIEPVFDILSRLPTELALKVLSFLGPHDLFRATQTSRKWHALCEDDSLWRKKCQETGIQEVKGQQHTHLDSDSGLPHNPWKRAFVRPLQINWNWRHGRVTPKVLFESDNDRIMCFKIFGNLIVAASRTFMIVWSATTGECLRTLMEYSSDEMWVSDNTLVGISYEDETLWVWNMDTWECLHTHTLLGHSEEITCYAFHGRKVVSGSFDGLRLWDIDSGECVQIIPNDLATLDFIQYNTKYLMSASTCEWVVKVWDPLTGQCLHTLLGHNEIHSLEFNGTHIASSSFDYSVRVWDVETGERLRTLKGCRPYSSFMQIQDNLMITCPDDHSDMVKVWDLPSGQCICTFQVGVMDVSPIGTTDPSQEKHSLRYFKINGEFLITVFRDGKVKLWELTSGRFLRDLMTLDKGDRGHDREFSCTPTKFVHTSMTENHNKLLLLNFDMEEV